MDIFIAGKFEFVPSNLMVVLDAMWTYYDVSLERSVIAMSFYLFI